MGKLPYQLIVNVFSFLGIGGFVFWTSHGGLRHHIKDLFGKDASLSDLKDRVGHMSDLFFYYASIATFLFVIVTLAQAMQAKLSKWLPFLQKITPSTSGFKQLLLEETHSLIIFMGIYIYLIFNNGMGLKNKQLVLFPYWFLVGIILEIVGRALTGLANQKIIFTRASFFLYSAMIILMLCQISGYRPFQSI